MRGPAVEYIESLVRAEPRGALERERRGLAPMRALLRRLGDPQHGLRCVHIAGSKGKGSTALMIEAAMEALGLRTGTFTSPHLEHWTERFRLDADPVPERLLDRTVEGIRPHVEALSDECPELAPTFFDVLCAAAFVLFRDAGTDFAILETGLGGRLDSTNVIRPEVTCITSIECEHTARLGTAIPRIAREKAGIVKSGVPLVLGRVPSAAARVIRARARGRDAAVFGLGEEIDAAFVRRDADTPRRPHHWQLRVSLGRGVRHEVMLPHPAPFIAHNAALALVCLDRLGLLASAGTWSRAARALAAAPIPGRGEIVGRAPWIVVDGAHTGESAAALAALIAALEHRAMDLVVSLGTDKDPAEVLPALLAGARRVYATRAERTRSRPAERLAAEVRGLAPALEVHAVEEPALALRAARRALAADDLLCVAGSMYLAGAARRALVEGRSARTERVEQRRSHSDEARR